jgi:hypothetical protein
MRFFAEVKILEANPYVLVSAARARRIKPDWKKPLPVLVRIEGKPSERPFRINMMPVGDGSFRLYLHGDVRKASGTKVGDRVRVDVAFDASYRGGPLQPMPAWFRVPLSRNRRVKQAWDALVPSRKKEILRYLVRLKSKEARDRNLARVLRALSGKKERTRARSFLGAR